MSAPLTRLVVAGRDAALWLSANVIATALKPCGLSVTAVELPSHLGAGDVYVALPAMEALHNRLGIDEHALLRATQGSYSLGQNFVDQVGGSPQFMHAFGAYGAPIDDKDFLAYWVKARGMGLSVELENFSLTAAAARHGRLLIPNDETEAYGRSDYGYHLPARAYVRGLRALALEQGVEVHESDSMEAVLDPDTGAIHALELGGGRRVEGQFFVDASGSGAELIGKMPEARWQSWRGHFAADRYLSASGPRLGSLPLYAELRAWAGGWAALYPSQAATHVIQAYSSESSSDEHALHGAVAACAFALRDPVVRRSDPGRRTLIWERNCVAIGEAGCTFDPVHGVDLHAIQLGLVHLLSQFPATVEFAAARDEYNRIIRSSFDRVRDFQSAYYALNRYGSSAFWSAARAAPLSSELAHTIATFRARGEIAPREDESFLPDSWRALFIGHGLIPETYLPTIDRTPPEAVKAEFRRMLGFVREQVLKQPSHDPYLHSLGPRDNG